MACQNLHENLPNDSLHTLKDFSLANKMQYPTKDENNTLRWTAILPLPQALDFVDGAVAPPTEVDGDIYVLDTNGGTIHADWDGALENDWVRYNGTDDAWYAITPVGGYFCFDITSAAYFQFDGADWVAFGGGGGLNNVVEDLTPQLGGNLDVNGFEIESISSTDIDLHSDNNIVQELGDDAGSNKVSVRDSNGTEQAAIDSDGLITAVAKSFLIDHPTKKDWKLQYGCLEGPEHGVYHRGEVFGDVIQLPDYFPALTDMKTVSVNLTPIGQHQELYVKNIVDNRVIIGSNTNAPTHAYYTIFAERLPITTEFTGKTLTLSRWERSQGHLQ